MFYIKYSMKLSTKNIIIGILILLIVILVKCNRESKNEYQVQNIINQNNIEVISDSLKTYKTKNGTLINERGLLISKKEELKNLNYGLYQTVKDLENQIKNIKPQIVIRYKYKIKTDTLYLNSRITALNDSTYEINFDKDTIYSENNSRHLAGSIIVRLMPDGTYYNDVQISKVKLTKDIINMDAKLVVGMKDDKLKVWLSTDYPGFDATSIDAVTLDENVHPQIRKLNNKKKFTVGPYIGFGLSKNLELSPSIGFGIQYSIIKF